MCTASRSARGSRFDTERRTCLQTCPATYASVFTGSPRRDCGTWPGTPETKWAEVSLFGCGLEVLLTVSDEGNGFDRNTHNGRSGIGLASMEERARLIGAELTIRSTPGKGTTITALVPRSEGRE